MHPWKRCSSIFKPLDIVCITKALFYRWFKVQFSNTHNLIYVTIYQYITWCIYNCNLSRSTWQHEGSTEYFFPYVMSRKKGWNFNFERTIPLRWHHVRGCVFYQKVWPWLVLNAGVDKQVLSRLSSAVLVHRQSCAISYIISIVFVKIHVRKKPPVRARTRFQMTKPDQKLWPGSKPQRSPSYPLPQWLLAEALTHFLHVYNPSYSFKCTFHFVCVRACVRACKQTYPCHQTRL